MSPSIPQPPVRHVVVSPSKPAHAIQMAQGWYYILAGLAVALLTETLLGPMSADGWPCSAG